MYVSLKDAMERCSQAGMAMNIVTLIRIAKKKGFLHQPAGKFSKCWLEEKAFAGFLENGG
jgi:hypothetical protein